MKRLKYILLLLFPVLLTIFLVKQLAFNKAVAAWFNDQWLYRQKVEIANGSGGALTNFQVNINIGTSALIMAGKMQSNCNDIRVVDNTGNVLPHWIETGPKACNSATNSTTVWAKVSSLPAAGGTVYVYYGNQSAANIANGNTVFEFFDDFADGTINTTKWSQGTIAATAGTNFSETGGNLVGGNNNRYIQSTTAFTGDYTAETRVYETTSAVNGYSTIGFYASSSNSVGILTHNTTSYTRNDAGWTNFAYNGASQWSRDIVKVVGVAALNATVSRTGETSGSYSGTYSNTGISSEYVRLSARYDDSAYDQSYAATWDWVLVRKAVATVPTTSNATEEVGTAPAGYWKFDEGNGTVANDASAGKNTGSITSATWQTEDQCVSGKCLDFNGSNSNVNVGANGSINITGDATYEAWIKLSAATYPDATTNWVIFNNESYLSYGTMLRVDGSTAKLYIRTNQAGAQTSSWSTSTISNNTWYHLAVVKSGSNVTFYINGKGEAGTTVSNPVTSSASMTIGSASQSFNGLLDEPRIYPYARTLAQIKTDYNAGKAHLGSVKGSSVNLGSNTKSNDALSNGLVGYWKMDESASPAVDSSGNGNNATWQGSTAAASGKFGNGSNLSTAGSYLDASNPATLGLTGSNLTISAWVNFTSCSTANTIVAKNNQYWLAFYQSGSVCQATYADSSLWDFSSFGYHGSISTGVWHHIAATKDANNLVTIYVDGVSIISKPFGGAITSQATSVTIGGNSSSYTLNGYLDEVRIYNRALTASEVTYLYNWAPGPIAYWDFEEGSGTTLHDRSGNGYDSTAFTGTTTWDTGKFGKALYFDGSTSYVTLPATIFAKKQKQITFEIWLKGKGQPTTSSIFQAGPSQKINVHAPWSNSNLYWDYGEACCGGRISKAMDANYMNGNWTHFAFTADTDTNFMQIYANGVLWHSGSVTPSAIVNAPTTFYLGAYDTTNYKYTGWLDEFKIYDYVRTGKQIVEDMNGGHPAPGGAGLAPGGGSQAGYWKFDEGYGSTANNSGSAGPIINGTLGSGSSAPSWSNNGIFQKALDFSTGDYVSVPSDASINNTTAMTATAWIRSNDTSVDQTIVSQNGPFFLRISGGKFRVGIYTGSWTFVNGNISLSNNTWYQVTLTYDGSTMKSYVNGVLDTNTAKTGSLAAFNTLYIGYPIVAGEQYSFNGLIDEVKFYNFALTADEIKLDYNHGSALVLGSTSVNTGNTAPINASSQDYCIPGDSTACASPVGEWKFEEGTGTAANDTSGNGNNGTFGATPPVWEPGKIGTGLGFTASKNVLDLGKSAYTLGIRRSATFEGWIKPKDNSASYLISDWNTNIGMTLRTNSNTSADFYVYPNNHRITATYTFSPNTWYHLAGVMDNATMYLYINGIGVGQTSLGEDIGNSASTLKIGNRGDQTLGSNSSTVDQVRVYNYARSPAQIAWDYNRGAPVGHWKLDECQGITANDSSGNNNYGTITIGGTGAQTTAGTCGIGSTAAAWSNGATGKFNASLNFDGTDDYVSIGTPSTLDIRTSPLSVSAWVKTNISNVTYINSTIAGNSSQYFLSLSDYSSSTPRATAYVNINGVGWSYIKGNTAINDGQWHQVMMTYDGSYIRVYHNGVIDASPTAASGALAAPGTFLIGAYQTAAGGQTNAQIDEVRVYNYALTSSQIKDLYNQGAVRFGN